jgi:TPR repeat protein
MLRGVLLVCVGALIVLPGGVAAQEGSTDTPSRLEGTQSRKVDPQALMRLGDLYFYGEVIAPELQKAFDYYRQAAEAGSQTGKLRMGEMLARGLGVAQDVERGRRIVQEVADTGSISAQLALADMYGRGNAGPMDPPQAIIAYEKAISQGSTPAMLRLGDIYRYGRFKAPQYKKAATYYRQAADFGDAYGLYSLGRLYSEGLARRAGSPAEGLKLLRQAERAGVAGAAVAISDSYFYGYGVRRDAKKAVAILTKAMNEGNIQAAKELVAIYRDGQRDGRLLLIKRNLPRARKLLGEIGNRISSGEMAIEQFLIDCASAKSAGYLALYNRLRKFSSHDQSVLVRDLRRVNPNLYVFFAQSRLREIGAFKGKATGKLSATTSRAIRRYCNRTGTLYFCRHDPMSSQSAEMLSYAF